MRIFVVIVVVAVTASVGSSRQADPELTLLRDQLDESTRSILKGASSVKTLRIKGPKSDDTTNESIRGYPIFATGSKLDDTDVRELVNILVGDALPVSGSRCPFAPAVAFQIADTEGKSVDALFCFACDVMELGSSARHNFRSVRGRVLKLAKKGLPDDLSIQELPSQKR